MADTNTFTYKHIDLSDPVVYEKYRLYLRTIVQQVDVVAIDKVLAFFPNWHSAWPDFRVQHPEQTKEIDQLLIFAQWSTLSKRTNSELIDLFKLHVNDLFLMHSVLDFSDDIDELKEILRFGLRDYLLTMKQFDERDTVKKQLLDTLMQNEEVITSAEFFRGIKAAQPTTKNWFSEYVEFIGETHSQFMQSRFLKRNENAKRLTSTDRHQVEMLIMVYERLRVSSSSPVGMEEVIPLDTPEGIKGVIEYGEVIPYTENQKNEYINDMKTYKQLLVESGQPVPEYLEEITGGVSSRPPVNAVKPAKGMSVDQLSGPNVEATAGPDHFTDQDATDVKRVADTIMVDTSKPVYQQTVQAILQELKLTFSSPELEKKFTDLLTSVVRGLRDTMELQSYVMEMNYSPDDVDRIIKVTKAAIASKVQTNTETAQALPNIQNNGGLLSETMGAASEAIDEPRTSGNTATQFSGIRSFLPKLRRSRRSRKPMIDDVKLQESMVMGPIDELRAMDLVEFRRLAPDPVVASNKLRDKINLLAEESVSKQAEGIQAFKASPLNMHYLELGNQSIASGQPVSDVIADLEAQGKQVVSVAEFNAITDLNRELRF